jgi:hypothetical protein
MNFLLLALVTWQLAGCIPVNAAKHPKLGTYDLTPYH